MPPANNQDVELYMLIGLVGLVLFVLLLFGTIYLINDFSKELKRINCEINRTHGHERKHWVRRRRRLWLSLLPFVKY